MRDREHKHSEATGPGDTHHLVSDTATSLVGSGHGLHRKHLVGNIGIQYELNATCYAQGCRQRDRVFFSRDSRGDSSSSGSSKVDAQAGKA